jgi:hypothetical protein
LPQGKSLLLRVSPERGDKRIDLLGEKSPDAGYPLSENVLGF